MSIKDDVSKLYRIPNKLDAISRILFIVSVVTSIVALSNNHKITAITTIVQIVVAVFYCLINVINDGYFWYEAEKARRINSIENGLGARLSELETEAYYNNPSKESLEKYALNLLESNFFSKEIAGKMIYKSFIKSAIAVALLVVSCRFLENTELLLIIAQTALSSYVLIDTVMLVLYKLRMDDLFKDGYALLITPIIKSKNKNALLLSYSVEYEIIKAYYKIRLDERVFFKNNDILAKQWQQILAHRNK